MQQVLRPILNEANDSIGMHLSDIGALQWVQYCLDSFRSLGDVAVEDRGGIIAGFGGGPEELLTATTLTRIDPEDPALVPSERAPESRVDARRKERQLQEAIAALPAEQALAVRAFGGNDKRRRNLNALVCQGRQVDPFIPEMDQVEEDLCSAAAHSTKPAT